MPAEVRPQPPTWRHAGLAALLIVVATGVLYGPTVHDYFAQDDFGVVGLLSQKSVTYFPRWFIAPWTENIWGYVPDEIRPFPALSYQLAGIFGAGSPEPNHLLNIALHAINALLVYGIARSAAGLGEAAATMAALVFVTLPIEAESVAWVTGRVDSMPACFYFGSFLLYVRSGAGSRRAPYLWSLALFFAALFSKQNTIVMAPALIVFDWLVGGRKIDASWRWMRPYLPYVLLTAGFLALRYVLFHEVAREGALSAQRFTEFGSDVSRHMVRLLFGGPGLRHWTMKDSGIVLGIAAAVVFIAMRSGTVRMGGLARVSLYFGVVWIASGVAPILVSGYYSPRHMYLASLGWAMLVGLAVDVLWQARPVPWGRRLAMVAGTALVVAYGLELRGVVGEWHGFAALSRAAVVGVEREAAGDPPGTLIIVGAPRRSWAFAVPHALRPPFADRDVTERALVISDSLLHCCDAVQWNDYTRRALQTWQESPSHPPVVAMFWDARTGRLSRLSDRQDPQLRTVVSLLRETDSRETLDSAIRSLLDNYVRFR